MIPRSCYSSYLMFTASTVDCTIPERNMRRMSTVAVDPGPCNPHPTHARCRVRRANLRTFARTVTASGFARQIRAVFGFEHGQVVDGRVVGDQLVPATLLCFGAHGLERSEGINCVAVVGQKRN